jgi:hypothetical protein
MHRPITRRSWLRGGAAFAGALALGERAKASPSEEKEKSTLVVFWLNGGPAGFFNSADSFLAAGAFGVTTNNVRDLGNGLYVDRGSLGALPSSALAHMASINFRHDIVRPHERARAAVLESGTRSQLLRIAASMPEAQVRCAVVNDLGLPVGIASDPPAERGVGFERVVDFHRLRPNVGASFLDDVRDAYAVPKATETVCDQRATFAAVETLVRMGTAVVFAQPAYTGRPDRQFDTHRDDAGVAARAVMEPITPCLSTFLERVLTLPQRNVVTVLVGEFSRTIPDSDHQPGGTATVIGKYVKTGTAGPQHADGAPPNDAPSPEGLWAYACDALGLDNAPFGRNPHPKLILPRI